MKAIILAAGYGTRMYPLTINCAKALLPIGKRKALDFIAEKISSNFFDEIIIVSNNKFCADFEKWKKETKSKIKITILNNGTNSSEEAKGVTKDLALGLENVSDDFLVISSDNIFGFDLNKMAAEFIKLNKKPLIAVTDIKDKEKAKRHGIVELDGNKIKSFEEKPIQPKSTIKSILCYILPQSTKQIVQELLTSGKNEHLLERIFSKESVFAFPFEEYCHDIGNIEDYNKICKIFGEQKNPNKSV
ncbi:MAG: nucleotidyltransferase family protein [archaeon]|jgi:glucose-1-phosphate thymidylyltransferase